MTSLERSAVFYVSGITTDLAEEVRRTMRAPQYGHPAHREIARGYGPCRVCLRTFDVGNEERILFTYQPFRDPGSLPAPGPVFIHANECSRYEGIALPSDFRTLPLVLQGYRAGGQLVAQERVGDRKAEDVLARIFDEHSADYVHIRNGEAGCFMARVDRARQAAAIDSTRRA
jgi:hypothetical protein